jgi:hypothetical protein
MLITDSLLIGTSSPMQHMKEFLERTNSVIKNPNLKTVGSKI